MKISIPPSTRQVLDAIYNYMHEFSKMLSMLSISEDLELQAPVEEGWVRIKFADRPRTKYFVYPSLKAIVEIADSTVPIPPYIDLNVKGKSFEYAAVPSIIVEGEQYELNPIVALALAKTVMRGTGYTIEASDQQLEDFVTKFLNDMDDAFVTSGAGQIIEDFTKTVKVSGPITIEFDVESTPLLCIHYYARTRSKPYMTVGIYIEEEDLGEDGEELEPALSETPILVYTGNTIKLDKNGIAIATSSGPKLQINSLINTLINTLREVGNSKVLDEVKSWLSVFVQEYAKAVVVAKMYSI